VIVVPAGVVDADASAFTAKGAGPTFGFTLSAATGGPALTDTGAVADEVWPVLFVTRTVNPKLPTAMYWWVAMAPACGPAFIPSPKSNS
jgi:hypothetical protein